MSIEEEVSSEDFQSLVDQMSGGEEDPFVEQIDGLADRLAAIRIEDDGIVLQSARDRCLVFHVAWSPGSCRPEAGLVSGGPPFIEGF